MARRAEGDSVRVRRNVVSWCCCWMIATTATGFGLARSARDDNEHRLLELQADEMIGLFQSLSGPVPDGRVDLGDRGRAERGRSGAFRGLRDLAEGVAGWQVVPAEAQRGRLRRNHDRRHVRHDDAACIEPVGGRRRIDGTCVPRRVRGHRHLRRGAGSRTRARRRRTGGTWRRGGLPRVSAARGGGIVVDVVSRQRQLRAERARPGALHRRPPRPKTC